MTDGEVGDTDLTADPALYREAFTAATGANLITDEAFRIVDANRDCLDTLGWDRESLVGDTMERLFDEPLAFEAATDRLEAGEQWRDECVVLDGEGRPIEVEMSATSLLRHNLRNDANVVLGHLETAAAATEDESVEESVEVAKRRMEGSLDRAHTAREFSRHLATDVETTLYPVDLDGALTQAINKVDLADAALEKEVPSGLLVRGDETLTAALRNVVENAVEHTGAAPTVRVTAEADGETVTLRVADDGPGIPPERREHVLERGGSAVRHGQGLGLFFVDRLLRVYGGELRLDDSELGGCLVELTFQRASAEGVESDGAF